MTERAVRIYQKIRAWTAICFCTSLVIIFSSGVHGRAYALTTPANITSEELKSRRSAIENASDLDADQKTEALKYIDQAIGFLQIHQANQNKIKELGQLIASAPDRLKKITSDLAKDKPVPTKEDFLAAKAGVERLEQRFRQSDAQLSWAQTLYKNYQDRIASELSAITKIPDTISLASKRLEEIQSAIELISADPTLNDTLPQTRILSMEAERHHLKTEITLNQQQQNGHNLLVELFRGERDLAAKQINYHESVLKALTDSIQHLRSEEAVQQVELAQTAMLKTSLQPESVQEQFDINVQLSMELETIAKEQTELLNRMAEYQGHLKTLEIEFETAKKRVELDVLTDVIGMALRSQRINLPSSDRYELTSKRYLVRMSEISERHFELDRLLRDIPTTEELIRSIDIISARDKKALKPSLDKLLNSRQELIVKVQSEYERIIKSIQDIEFTKKKIISISKEFGELLDRHLLWIQSSKPLNWNETAKVFSLAKDISRPKFWISQYETIKKTIFLHPLQWLLGFCSGLLLLLAARKGKNRLTAIAADIDQQTDDTIILTLQALGLTLLISMVWPFLFLFPATQVSAYLNKSLIGNIPHPLTYAWTLVFWITLYNLCRPAGLAQIHFRWPEPVRQLFRSHLTWLMPTEGVAVLLYYLMETSVGYEYRLLLGIIAICVQCTALSIFGAIVFRFKTGVTSFLLKTAPTSWSCRLRYIWYPAIVLIPVYILWLALSGYYFSAIEVLQLMYKTLLLFFGIVVVSSLILRLLMLARRNIALKKAMETHPVHPPSQPAEKQRADHTAGRADVMENIVKLSAIDEQTRSLLKLTLFVLGLAGIWTIWAPVMPALGILEEVEFWTYTAVVSGAETIVPITLANILLAVIVTIAIFVAVRNLPGLIEVILLNHLPMDPGARYAFIAISRYAIVAMGIFIVLGTIGIKWSNMQWLVAALSVGIGFGLQEIVANFISGLIVLFERPFSVGDTVTVGEVNGTVTRIRIRATTIEDWDKKELIVPNKEFITGRLINWSLSDQIIRIRVPVGIAYGSDTDLAEKLLMKAALDNSYVLASPKPRVVFLRFGDNSLDFEVRVFINDIENWMPMLHDINRTINKSFEENGITIAFPQRDVHLDASTPIPVKMVADTSETEP